ncbi:MAG: MBOAT family protein [Candidatus Heimdallarchaeota archaeon]|nr:MBOAT family protein [Candidatus Heimdallarchaeota archaeon]
MFNFVVKKNKKIILYIAITINILILSFFKLQISGLISTEHLSTTFSFMPDQMPIGFSFFSFTSIAYLLDSFNNRIKKQTDFKHYLLYQMFFSKVVSGPIIRFPQLEKNESLSPTLLIISLGIRRFIVGLIKKVLVADTLAIVVNQVFTMKISETPMLISWIGMLFYTIQIFFDFSGYTDMAIGIGMFFGFQFPENFDYPYVAKSIGEFWRRWHITLSNWFRDYLFFPLEKYRKRKISQMPQAINVLIIFLLTGLWHGYSFTFIVWGLIHGFAISFENSAWGQKLKKSPAIFQHFYTLIIITFSWVFFRSPDFSYAIAYIQNLFTFDNFCFQVPVYHLTPIEYFTWLMFIIGIIFSHPFFENTLTIKDPNTTQKKLIIIGKDIVLLSLFIFAIARIFDSTFLTSLYGNF